MREQTGGCFGSKAFAALLMSTALVSANVVALVAAQAQERSAGAAQERTFSIRPQPLPNALTIFGQQTGMQVSVDAAAVRNLTSPGASGMMTPAIALNRLLAGTGLSYRLTGASTVVIGTPRPQTAAGPLPAGAIALDTIDVQGASNPNSTMTPMAPYAGGQVARGGQLGMLGNRDVMDTPFSQTNYTSKTIKDQQARSLGDVLANEPSVITGSKSGGANEFVEYRGFQTQTYAATNSLNGLPGMAPLQFPSTDYIERVEVLRGPSALLNGASTGRQGALGGMVNLVSKKAGDEPLTELTTRYMSDSQFGTHVDFGRRFGDNKEFGIRFNGSLDGGDTPVDTQRSKFGTAAVNLDYRGERVRLSIDAAHQSSELTGSPPAALKFNSSVLTNLKAVPNAPDNNTASAPSWARAKQEITLGMAQGEVDVTDNLTAYAAVGSQRYQSYGNFDSLTLANSAGAVTMQAKDYYGRTDVLSMQGGLRATAVTGPVSHTLALNMSQLQWTFGTTPNTCQACSGAGALINVGTLYNPMFPATELTTDPGAFADTSRIVASSIAIADTMSVLNDRVQLTAGARRQRVKSEGFGTATLTTTADTSVWSPSFALVVKPWEHVSLYGSYIEDLAPGIVPSSGYANYGEVLPPTKSQQYETGVKIDWGTVTTTLAAFQITQPSSIYVPSASGGLPTLTLDGEQRNRGIELNAFGELAKGVRLLGGITYIDAVRTRTQNGTYDGARGVAVPKYRAVIGGEWDTPFVEGLTLTGRFTYTSDELVAATRLDLTVPSWTQVDLGARYTFASPWNAKPITIRFNVDNVFDNSYWKVMFLGANLWRSDPRTYHLSTTFKF